MITTPASRCRLFHALCFSTSSCAEFSCNDQFGIVKLVLGIPSRPYCQRKSGRHDAFPTKIQLGRIFRDDFLGSFPGMGFKIYFKRVFRKQFPLYMGQAYRQNTIYLSKRGSVHVRNHTPWPNHAPLQVTSPGLRELALCAKNSGLSVPAGLFNPTPLPKTTHHRLQPVGHRVSIHLL